MSRDVIPRVTINSNLIRSAIAGAIRDTSRVFNRPPNCFISCCGTVEYSIKPELTQFTGRQERSRTQEVLFLLGDLVDEITTSLGTNYCLPSVFASLKYLVLGLSTRCCTCRMWG